jgi:hypothetical protein
VFICGLYTKVDQGSFDYVKRGEICVAGSARFRQPFAQLPRFVDRSETTRTRERKCHEGIGSAMRNERRLQCSLFAQVQSQKEIEFHWNSEI